MRSVESGNHNFHVNGTIAASAMIIHRIAPGAAVMTQKPELFWGMAERCRSAISFLL
jgi:TctA family transporter